MEELLLFYVENGIIDLIYMVVGLWDFNIVFIMVLFKYWDE